MTTTLIIGAGPAGMACAAKLTDLGRPVTVLEAAPVVGGLARTLDLWGQRVDLGPHRFFSSDRIVVDFWRRFVGQDFTRVTRLTRISYGGTFFKYPLEAFDALGRLGLAQTARALASYGKARLRPHPAPRSFEEWVVNRFGRHLFSIFFQTYSEKLWGVPCSRLDADWAAQRIKKLSLFEAAKAALFKDRGRTHKTLVDEFAYPLRGSGVVYERMKAHVEQGGGEVRLSTPVKRVLLEGGRAAGVELQSGEVLRGEAVVSTMPLSLMVRSLPGTPPEVLAACDQLRYRNTILVYLEVDSASLFPDNWVYVHSPQVQHGRVTNFRNWSPQLYGDRPTSILCLEFWCFDQDPLWTEEEGALVRRAEAELRAIGLCPPGRKVLNGTALRLHRSYPVYETGYQAPLQRVQAHVNGIPGLYAIGRYGAFKYNNQDHSILMGLLAATELHTGSPQHLWDVNTDGEYQESAEVSRLFEER